MAESAVPLIPPSSPGPTAHPSSGSRCSRPRKLLLHLPHHLPHGCEMTGSAALAPRLEAFRCLFQMPQELRIREHFAELRNRRLDAFPDAKKLAARLEEEVFVQQPIIEQRARILPVAEHLHGERAVFRARPGDTCGILDGLHKVVLEIPVACLTKLGLAP